MTRGPPRTVPSVRSNSTGALLTPEATTTEAATSTADSNDSSVYRLGRWSRITTV
jgi:hypothetical protein